VKYKIRLTAFARKQVRKIDQRYLSALYKALDRLANNPRQGEPLGGKFKGAWKLRFSRYRVIYLIRDWEMVVIVIDVDHRRQVYR